MTVPFPSPFELAQLAQRIPKAKCNRDAIRSALLLWFEAVYALEESKDTDGIEPFEIRNHCTRIIENICENAADERHRDATAAAFFSDPAHQRISARDAYAFFMQTVKDSRDIKTFEGFLKAWENFHPPKGLALTPFAVEHFRSEREAKRKKAGREAKKRSRSKTG